MAHKVVNSLYNFRDTFRIVNPDALRWFPGHMGKGMRQMQQRLKQVDCVIEVHDARVPLSGRNPNFHHTVIGIKPHILVLNKKDLADLEKKARVEDLLCKNGVQNIIYTNCKDQKCSGVRKIVSTVVKLVSSSDRYNRNEEKDYSVMVIGVPNVGKSSLINALRAKHIARGNAAQVGAIAGITKSVQTKIKVSESPLVFLMDTPGILTPNVPNIETGLKLALCSCFQDHLVGFETIADYLLFWLNKNNNFRYVEMMGLDEPVDDIGIVLTKCAVKNGLTQKQCSLDGLGYIHRPNIQAAAQSFIKAFRNGEFGKVLMDIDHLDTKS